MSRDISTDDAVMATEAALEDIHHGQTPPPASARQSEEGPQIKPKKRDSVAVLRQTMKIDNPEDKYLLDMLEQWDRDGDGSFSAEEVLRAAKQFNNERNKVKNLKKILIASMLFVVVVIGVLIGVSVAGAEMAKDSRPDGSGVLTTTKSGEVVQTATATAYVPLEDYAMLPDAALRNVKNVVFKHKGETVMFNVQGVVRKSPSEIDLYLAQNTYAKKVSVGASVEITFADGSVEEVESLAPHRSLQTARRLDTCHAPGEWWLWDTAKIFSWWCDCHGLFCVSQSADKLTISTA